MGPPAIGTDKIERFRCIRSERVNEKTMRSYCQEHEVSPASVESVFCVVSRDQSGKTRLLERDASLLARGTIEFAKDQEPRLAIGDRRLGPRVEEAVYVPVIVTTASLWSARYNPRDQVSLEDGVLMPDLDEIREERWVRLRKPLTTPEALGQLSVFVVQARDVVEFFAELRPVGLLDGIDGDRVRVPSR